MVEEGKATRRLRPPAAFHPQILLKSHFSISGLRYLLPISVACLVVCCAIGATPQGRPDRIVIIKHTRTLLLMHRDKVLKAYKGAFGAERVGPKERAGDHKTPEGDYIVDGKKERSRFHLALHLSYPNADDRARVHSEFAGREATSKFTG
jgi:L,D-transpeptidase catalytic domain